MKKSHFISVKKKEENKSLEALKEPELVALKICKNRK